MARTSSVKLAIASTFDDAGARKAQRSLAAFDKQVNTSNNSLAKSYAEQSVQAQLSAEKTAQSWEQTGRTLTTVGKGMTAAITVPIVATAAASVAAAIETESSFANVRKTVDATEDQYRELESAARALSTTQPVDVNTINNVMALGGQLGIATDNLLDFSQVVTGLDIATDMDAETAATNLAQFANITKMAQTDASNYGSTIVALGNNMATTESKISDMAMRLASAGSQAGMSQADILGISAALASMGMEADAGGTALSRTMTEISTQVSMGGDNLEGFAKIAGMSAQEFATAWKTDAASAFQAFIVGLANGTEAGQDMNVMLNDLGITEIRQSDAMRRLAGNTSVLTDAVSLANGAWQENTALQTEVDKKNATTEAQLQVLKNKVYDVGIEIGQTLLPALSDAVDAAGPVIDAAKNLAKGFSDLDEGSQKTIIGIAATAAALGPVALVGGKVATTIGTVVRRYGELKAAALANRAAMVLETGATSKNELTKRQLISTTVAGTAATKAFSVAMNVAKMAAGTAAIAIASMVVTATATRLSDQAERAKNLADATTGLEKASRSATFAISAVGASTDSASSSMTSGAKNVQAMRDEVDGLIEKQAQLAKTMSETNQKASSDAALLESYKDTINELANKSSKGAEDQARLQLAVQGLNAECGTAYKVIDAENGVIADQEGVVLKTTDAINEYIRVKQLQIQLDAAVSNYKAAWEQNEANQKAFADTQAYVTEKAQEYHAAMERGEITADQYNAAIEGLYNQQKEAADLYNSSGSALDNESQRMNLLQQAVSGGADSLAAFTTSHGLMLDTIDARGQSLTTFQDQLGATGVSVETLRTIEDENLLAMANAYDGNIGSITDKLVEFGKMTPEQAKQAGDNYAASLGATAEKTKTEAQKIADATSSSLSSLKDKALVWGREAGDNFASGIGYAVGTTVSTELDRLSRTVADYLKHTKPKKGAMSEGEDVWGEHAGQNFAQGLRASYKDIGAASEGAALTAQSGMATPFSASISQPSFALGGLTDAGWTPVSAQPYYAPQQASTTTLESKLDRMISLLERLDANMTENVAAAMPSGLDVNGVELVRLYKKAERGLL